VVLRGHRSRKDRQRPPRGVNRTWGSPLRSVIAKMTPIGGNPPFRSVHGDPQHWAVGRTFPGCRGALPGLGGQDPPGLAAQSSIRPEAACIPVMVSVRLRPTPGAGLSETEETRPSGHARLGYRANRHAGDHGWSIRSTLHVREDASCACRRFWRVCETAVPQYRGVARMPGTQGRFDLLRSASRAGEAPRRAPHRGWPRRRPRPNPTLVGR